jgi:hypothetical protein
MRWVIFYFALLKVKKNVNGFIEKVTESTKKNQVRMMEIKTSFCGTKSQEYQTFSRIKLRCLGFGWYFAFWFKISVFFSLWTSFTTGTQMPQGNRKMGTTENSNNFKFFIKAIIKCTFCIYISNQTFHNTFLLHQQLVVW